MGSEKDIHGHLSFHDSIRWIDMEGKHPLATPGRSPFVYKSDPSNHVLKIHSLDLDLSDDKPEGIKFDEPQLEGLPQTLFYQTIRLSGSLNRPLEQWPFFCIQQSLAEGEPPGYPGLNPLRPSEDERLGWLRIFQDGRQLMATEYLVAGPVDIHLCCVGMLDDPSQGGLRGKYVFEFEAYLEADLGSPVLTTLQAEIWIGPSAE